MSNIVIDVGTKIQVGDKIKILTAEDIVKFQLGEIMSATVESGMVKSKSELRRIIKQGGFKIHYGKHIVKVKINWLIK